jgi:hypothetical protein
MNLKIINRKHKVIHVFCDPKKKTQNDWLKYKLIMIVQHLNSPKKRKYQGLTFRKAGEDKPVRACKVVSISRQAITASTACTLTCCWSWSLKVHNIIKYCACKRNTHPINKQTAKQNTTVCVCVYVFTNPQHTRI